MQMKLAILACVSAVALVGCSCENNTPPPAETPVPPAQGVAVGEPNPSAPGVERAAPPAADPNKTPVDGEATLTAPATVTAGAEVKVAWTGPGNNADYVDLVLRGFAETRNEIAYAYVVSSGGTVTVNAPTTAGDYDLRYILDLGSSQAVKVTVPLTVTAAEATLKAPGTAETGQAFDVAWTGPNGRGDYIDIVKAGHAPTSGEITYAYTSAGNPAKLEAPSAPGTYEIRYLLEGPGGRKVPAKIALAVTQAKATLKAPESVAKGAKFKVEFTGPNSSGDYIDLVEKGSAATSGEKSYFYTNLNAELTAPAEAGEYEVRYILDAPGGRTILTRIPVVVR